jgi:hypothetical protein
MLVSTTCAPSTQEKRFTGANELEMYCSEECKKAVEGE